MLIALTCGFVSIVLSQTAPPSDAERRAVEAAERAAAAAQSAAESAAKAAAAAERIAQQAAPSAPAPGAPPAPAAKEKPSGWTGTVGVGFISLTGNARTLTFNANASLERRLEEWILSAKANGVYGRTRLAGQSGDPQVVALGAGGQLRADRFVSSWVTVYLTGGLETDHVKSVESREFGEGGSGLIWIDVKEGELSKALLRTDVAFRYSFEKRFQYYPTAQNLDSVTLVAPRFGLAFRYALSKEIRFQEDAEVLPNVTGDSRVLVNSISKLSSRLTETFSLGVSFTVNYDSAPAIGKVPTDTALALTLEAAI